MATWHTRHKEGMSTSDKIAEKITNAIGSTTSIVLHTMVFVLSFFAVYLQWIALAQMLLMLTTVVSLEAIYLCLFLQRSSNMHGDRDRIQAEEDYKTNREAKLEVEAIQIQLARVEDEKLDTIIKLLGDKPLVKKKK